MPKKSKLVVAVAYVPVLHRGYLQFFDKSGAEELYVIGANLLKAVDYLRKDLRALPPKKGIEIIAETGAFKKVAELDMAAIADLDKPTTKLVFPDEDISREVAKFFKKATISYYPVFLRWDRRSIEDTNLKLSGELTNKSPKNLKLMRGAYEMAARSSDIWRRVGAILVDKSGREIGAATNQGESSSSGPWMEGDPRNIFSQGVGIEMSLFTHAEAALIAEAAKKGTALEGASMYVTTFPCPACAKLIARSGIKSLFYDEGYGVLDGERVLRDYGVRLLRVIVKDSGGHPGTWVPYKKS